jgi:hypothetical protein
LLPDKWPCQSDAECVVQRGFAARQADYINAGALGTSVPGRYGPDLVTNIGARFLSKLDESSCCSVI